MLVSAVPLTSTLEGGRLLTKHIGLRKSLVTMLIVFYFPARQPQSAKATSDPGCHDS